MKQPSDMKDALFIIDTLIKERDAAIGELLAIKESLRGVRKSFSRPIRYDYENVRRIYKEVDNYERAVEAIGCSTATVYRIVNYIT